MRLTKEREPLPPQELIEAFAAAAHGIWCDHQQRKGWRHGAEYHAEAKTDPCICTWDDLPAFDKDQLVDGDAWYHELQSAVREVGFTLRCGSDELRLDDAPIGARVRLTLGDGQEEGESERWVGEIVDVTPSPRNSGRLLSIGVRWQNDSIEQYLPDELEVVDDEG